MFIIIALPYGRPAGIILSVEGIGNGGFVGADDSSQRARCGGLSRGGLFGSCVALQRRSNGGRSEIDMEDAVNVIGHDDKFIGIEIDIWAQLGGFKPLGGSDLSE